MAPMRDRTGRHSRGRMAEGKVPHGILKGLLARLTGPGREVLIGPRVGEDAFAVTVGQTVVVGTTDPITFTAEHAGYYAVNVNANDVATMGARPRWFLATVLVPPGWGARALGRIFEEIDKTCVGLGVRLLGGHTEVTSAVTRPVVIGAMLGTASRKGLVDPRRARPGDVVLLTKRLAIEGTAIIARERRRWVEAALGKRRAARARAMLLRPGISIVREALSAVAAAPVSAMHDPTEGGLLWGLREMSLATGLGTEVDLDKIPIYEETRLVCRNFGLDPLGLIASGSLLIAAGPRNASRIGARLARLGMECTDIGRLGGKGLRFRRAGRRVPVPRLAADEITRVLASRQGLSRGRSIRCNRP
jgi:hydrogenase expression/formation protein HypE